MGHCGCGVLVLTVSLVTVRHYPNPAPFKRFPVELIGEVLVWVTAIQPQSRLMERFGCGVMVLAVNLATTLSSSDPALFKQFLVELTGEA
jgi:hypothetical protein